MRKFTIISGIVILFLGFLFSNFLSRFFGSDEIFGGIVNSSCLIAS